MSARCRGNCCRAFTLPFSPTELQDHAEKQARRDANPGAGYEGSKWNEIEQVAGMAVYLGRGWMDADSGDFISEFEGLGRGYNMTGARDVYTCRNLRDNGDCGIYETRPKMCRDYPYEQPCHFSQCAAQQKGACGG